jgi:hypothetical protein
VPLYVHDNFLICLFFIYREAGCLWLLELFVCGSEANYSTVAAGSTSRRLN